ncbi:MAG: M20 family metallopeptidase [Anaerolineae bacterium]|nr:M20 family metallopeptidase [Anaerolineae bacterium]MDW7991904.1 M20 family metallopeptidase [Anaerolineae bacterium]
MTPSPSDLLPWFEARTSQILDLLRQFVELESPSTDKAATDRLARLVAEVARESGARVEWAPQSQRGDHLLATWGEDGEGFLLLCHLDTVWPVGTLAERPWRVEGERAFGPGVYDDKASAAIILAALQGMRKLGLSPRYPVRALFNSDEELGSDTSRALIEREALRARVVLCLEPARPDGALKVWRKGTGRYVVTAYGRAAHAGADHERGINAIEELAHQVLRLQKMTDYLVGTTVNVGWIQGGTRTNIVPDRAQIRVDVRARTAAEMARIDAAIRGLRPVLPGARMEIEGGMSRPPMEESPVTLEPFRRAQEIGAMLGLTLTADGTGGASDANFTAALGVPTLDGLGAVGDNAHSPEEYVWIPSLPQRAALLAALLAWW